MVVDRQCLLLTASSYSVRKGVKFESLSTGDKGEFDFVVASDNGNSGKLAPKPYRVLQ